METGRLQAMPGVVTSPACWLARRTRTSRPCHLTMWMPLSGSLCHSCVGSKVHNCLVVADSLRLVCVAEYEGQQIAPACLPARMAAVHPAAMRAVHPTYLACTAQHDLPGCVLLLSNADLVVHCDQVAERAVQQYTLRP